MGNGAVLKEAGRCVLGGLLAICLASCGGNDEAKWPGGDGPGTSEWKPGVFAPAENFESHCEEPRLGVNPFTNRPYSDVQGTIADENNFLRSYSNDTYLWQGPRNYIELDPSVMPAHILQVRDKLQRENDFDYFS